MESLTWPQVLAWRMERQFLLGPAPGADAVAVARRLAGVQAQVASSAALAITLRGGEPPAAALARGELMKTWAMRGTLHLLPVDEAAAYLALCAALRSWEKPSWIKHFGATPAEMAAMAEIAAEVLSGTALTRDELVEALLERTGSAHLREALGSGWGMVLKPLAWWGVLCHGPSRGSKVTFASPADLPGWRGLPPADEAARTVVPAYLRAHGPATPDAFDTWLTRRASRKGDLRAWFAACDDLLVQVSVEDVPMYALAEDVPSLLAAEPTGAVRLLGPFDPYVLGAGTGSAHLIPAEHRAEVSRTAGWIAPVVLHGGRVAGTWDPETAEPALWDEVPAAALADAFDRVAPFLRRP